MARSNTRAVPRATNTLSLFLLLTVAVPLLGVTAHAFALGPDQTQLTAPPGIDTWCGKAYRAYDAAFDPGGALREPEGRMGRLVARTRWSVYLEKEERAGVLLDAVGLARGERARWSEDGDDGGVGDKDEGAGEGEGSGRLLVDVSVVELGLALATKVSVPADSTDYEIVISLRDVPARLSAYNITVTATLPDSKHRFQTAAGLYKLPARTDGGSTARLDNLHGGIWLRSNATWQPVFPVSYYINWGGWLVKSLANLDAFRAAGYNMVHIVPDCSAPNKAFNFSELLPFLDRADALGLLVQYDMRCTYQNASMLREQLALLQHRPSLLLWYTADEPDGVGDALDAPATTYRALKQADPYHPVSLVLNCENFHYAPYAAGAEVIMTDVYPVGVNATFSRVFGTPCNATYGCCGCDNCLGTLADVPARIDRFAEYQRWLGLPRKPIWAVPQAFGKELHWDRYPTGDEVAVMAMLAVNHGAKGLVSWLYPTMEDIAAATSKLARLLTSTLVTEMLLGSDPQRLRAADYAGGLDVAAWTLGQRMLISAVNAGLHASHQDDGGFEIMLPARAQSIVAVLYGSPDWEVRGNRLRKRSLGALECSFMLVGLSDDEV